jgi:hypothetical protein
MLRTSREFAPRVAPGIEVEATLLPGLGRLYSFSEDLEESARTLEAGRHLLGINETSSELSGIFEERGVLSMFWSSLIRTVLAATNLPQGRAGLPFALHTQGMRANEQSDYAPTSSRRRL